MDLRAKSKLFVTKLGLKVFPCRPRDKRPLTSNGFKDASDNLAQLERWWIAHPNANIGLPTGAVNGIVVVDFDYHHWDGRDEQVDEDGEVYSRPVDDMVLEFFGGNIPNTWIVETPSGGYHFYFRHPGEVIPNSASKVGQAVDIRGDGGYVVAPPSIHPNGNQYLWAVKPGEAELAPLPDTLLAKIKTAKREVINAEIKGDINGDRKHPIGGRNQALTSYAGSMQRRGMDPSAVLAALLAENEAKCVPPLPEEEVLQIANSVSRYEPDPEALVETEVKRKRGLELSSVADLLQEPPPIKWILPGRLARGDCALIVGPPGCGKSWLTLDLAISGALGLPVFGEITMADDLPFLKVLYVDEENPGDEINRRMHVIFNAMPLNGHRDQSKLDLEARMFVTDPCQGFTFKNPQYIESLTQLVEQIDPDLIIFDSMTAVSGIVDENSAVQVREFFHEKLYPLRRINNSAILCVHHSNKKAFETEGNETATTSGQIRGSIDYEGVVDACLFASAVKDKDTGAVVKRRLKQTKVRRDSEPPALTWGLQVREGERLCIRPQIIEDTGYDLRTAKGKAAKAVTVRDAAARLAAKMREGD